MPTQPPAAEPRPDVPWRRYVAIGDSFTEGLWDGDDQTGVKGWADRLAAALSARRVAAGQPPIEYANLAIRGRLARPIIAEQLGPALALKPDLVSLVGGGNDALRVTTDVNGIVALLDQAVAKLRAAGADVILANSADPVNSPIIKLTRGRVATLYNSIWSLGRRHGAYVVDLWGMKSLLDWRLWCRDRIHLTSEGHRRVANAALVALGLGPDDPDWDTPLPPRPAQTWQDQLAWNAQWAKEELVPWMVRHFKGQSSGDGRGPKRPWPLPIDPAPAVGPPLI